MIDGVPIGIYLTKGIAIGPTPFRPFEQSPHFHGTAESLSIVRIPVADSISAQINTDNIGEIIKMSAANGKMEELLKGHRKQERVRRP